MDDRLKIIYQNYCKTRPNNLLILIEFTDLISKLLDLSYYNSNTNRSKSPSVGDFLTRLRSDDAVIEGGSCRYVKITCLPSA